MTDWAAVATLLHQDRMQKIQAMAPVAQVPIADSPETAPGYRYLGCVYFTTPHPFYPPDPAVTRAMKEFCPDYVPLWCRWFFLEEHRDSGSWREVSFDRHIIARNVKDPRLSHQALFGAWGSEAKGWGKDRPYKAQLVGPRPAEGWPNYLEGHWHYTRERSAPHPDMPGDFAPYDLEMVDFLREQMMRPEVGETIEHYWRRRLIDGPEERRAAEALKQEAETERIEGIRRKYETRLMDQAGSDWDRQVVEKMIRKRDVVYDLGNGRKRRVRLPLPNIPGVCKEPR